MIEHLTLRNWRGYEKLHVELAPGLTFVVAENGTGKTSLVHGASWAFFGDSATTDPAKSQRLKSEPISAEMSVNLAGSHYTIARSWPVARRQPSLGVCTDAAGTDIDLDSLIGTAFGLAPDVLRDLWFVPEMRLATEGALFTDVARHLRGLLGIDAVEAVARRAGAVESAASQQAKKLKHDVKLSQSRRTEIETRLAQATEQLDGTAALLRAAEERRRTLQAELDAAVSWDRYQTAEAGYALALSTLQARLDDLGGGDVDALEEAVAQREADVDGRIAALQAESDVLEGLNAQLVVAGGECPLCLQPLDASHALAARERHANHLAQLRADVAALEIDRGELRERHESIRALSRELLSLQRPVQPAAPRPRATGVLGAEIDHVDGELAELNGRRGALTAEASELRGALRADDDLAATTEVARQAFAREAAAKVLREAADATAHDRDSQGLAPLAKALRGQWSQFFPRRGAPDLTGIDLIVQQGDLAVTYGQLSGGERVLASLITRLLFVASATRLQSVWLDEPLEHLDPTNRVRVAKLLAQVCQPGHRIGQIVVTTYEEGLARSMARRYEHVNLLYVSTEPLF